MWANPQESLDFFTFTKEIYNGDLCFLCSEHLFKIKNPIYYTLKKLKQITKINYLHVLKQTIHRCYIESNFLKNAMKFLGKHLRLPRLEILPKRSCSQMFSQEFCHISKRLFCKTPAVDCFCILENGNN